MDITIKKTEPYQANFQSKSKDRIRVTLDMSTKDFSEFRKSVELSTTNTKQNTCLTLIEGNPPDIMTSF